MGRCIRRCGCLLSPVAAARRGRAFAQPTGRRHYLPSWIFFRPRLARFIYLFGALGHFGGGYDATLMLSVLAVVCAACTLVESLPLNRWLDDNISVPALAGGLSAWLLPVHGVAALAAPAALLATASAVA